MTGAMTMRSRPLVSSSRRTRRMTASTAAMPSPMFSAVEKVPLSCGLAVIVGHQADAG